MNKNTEIDKIISTLINRAEKDIKVDELLSNDSALKEDTLRLFLLQQASEKIIKAWFLVNIRVWKLFSPYLEEIKIDKKTINNLTGITEEEKERLNIIVSFQKEAFDIYNNTINSAVGELNKNNSLNKLLKNDLKHDPVKDYLLKIIRELNDFFKFSMLIPAGVISMCIKENDKIEIIKNFSKDFIKIADNIIKQLNVNNPKEIIKNLNLLLGKNDLGSNNISMKKVNHSDNTSIFLQSEGLQRVIVAVLIIIAIAISLSKMEKKEEEKLERGVLIFFSLFFIIPYFPLVAYLAKFENISRYNEISNDYSSYKNSENMKEAILCINDLHTLVKDLIDNAKENLKYLSKDK